MQMAKSYITYEKGEIQDVIIKYDDYKKIEKFVLDIGLAKSMEEIVNEEEFDLEEAKKMAGYSKGGSL
jgi:hypothetical protein